MKLLHLPCSGVLLGATALLGTLPAQNAGEYTTELSYKAFKKWNVILPNETWTEVLGIPIEHAEGTSFATDKVGLSLSIDTDADGKFDARVKGSHGFAVLRAKRKDGSSFTYAIRVKLDGKIYRYASSGVMGGSVYNVPIQVIDQNNDGIYNQYGVDAMIVGKSRAASYLSKVINLKGDLYSFSVSADGKAVTVKPYQGESGMLAVRKGVNIHGRLLSAVVSEADRSISFEVGNDSSLRVPVGSYKFTGGFAKKGGDTAELGAGKMRPIVVKADETSSLQWGAPLIAEFNYTRSGGKITVQPNVSFLGIAGEKWHTLLPDAKSPKLAFVDEDSGKVLETARFGGC